MILDTLFGGDRRRRVAAEAAKADAGRREFASAFIMDVGNACDGFNRIWLQKKFGSWEVAYITTTDGRKLSYYFRDHGVEPSDEAILYLAKALCKRYSGVMHAERHEISGDPKLTCRKLTDVFVYANQGRTEYEQRKAAQQAIRRV